MLMLHGMDQVKGLHVLLRTCPPASAAMTQRAPGKHVCKWHLIHKESWGSRPLERSCQLPVNGIQASTAPGN